MNGVANVTIQDTPRVKSKNIDVIAEYNKTKRKNAANFVVIGIPNPFCDPSSRADTTLRPC